MSVGQLVNQLKRTKFSTAVQFKFSRVELYLVSKKNKFFWIFITNIRYLGGTSEYQTIHKVLCSRTKFSTAVHVQLNSALLVHVPSPFQNFEG